MKPALQASTEIQLSPQLALAATVEPIHLFPHPGGGCAECCENDTSWFNVFLRTVLKSSPKRSSLYVVLQNCSIVILLTIWKPLVSFPQQ